MDNYYVSYNGRLYVDVDDDISYVPTEYGVCDVARGKFVIADDASVYNMETGERYVVEGIPYDVDEDKRAVYIGTSEGLSVFVKRYTVHYLSKLEYKGALRAVIVRPTEYQGLVYVTLINGNIVLVKNGKVMVYNNADKLYIRKILSMSAYLTRNGFLFNKVLYQFQDDITDAVLVDVWDAVYGIFLYKNTVYGLKYSLDGTSSKTDVSKLLKGVEALRSVGNVLYAITKKEIQKWVFNNKNQMEKVGSCPVVTS